MMAEFPTTMAIITYSQLPEPLHHRTKDNADVIKKVKHYFQRPDPNSPWKLGKDPIYIAIFDPRNSYEFFADTAKRFMGLMTARYMLLDTKLQSK